MFRVTDEAMDHLVVTRKRLEASGQREICFRLVPNGAGRFHLKLDSPNPDDDTYVHEGEVILAVSEDLVHELDGRTLATSESGSLALT